ncbi:MAG: helix-turn-helix transcriptional regulator [Bacteroidota bacterium]
MKKGIISRLKERISPDTHRFVRKNLEIAQRVAHLLEQRNWTQRDLANAIGKSESEISKWLSGQHNLTLKSIILLETALGSDILITPDQEENMTAKHAPHKTALPIPQTP